jgi:hypothetical protein
MHFVSVSMDPTSQSPNLLPSLLLKTLLLPGNEEIQVLDLAPLKLPPILPFIVKQPCTPRTPRRHLNVDELLRSLRTLIRRTTKKGTKMSVLGMSVSESKLTMSLGQILEKMLGITKNQVYYALAHRITPQRKPRGRCLTLDTPKRKQLINYVIQNRLTRREQ